MSSEQKPPATPPVRTSEEDLEEIIVEESILASRFFGPVPSPSHMKEYAEIDPSFPERFFAMAEKQQTHDHAVEKESMAANIKIVSEYQTLERRGQSFGFILAATGLVAGVITSVLGSPLAGGIIGTGGLAVLAGVFVYGARKNSASSQLVSPPPASQPPPNEEE